MNHSVTVQDLVKQYRREGPRAVDSLDFEAAEGEVFGLLGPNGAGKTTTVGVLTTRVRPTSGTALVAGVDVVADPTRARQMLAVVPQRNNLDRSLTIRQNLLFHAAYHGVPRARRNRRADDLLEQMGLTERAGSRVDAVSGGQAQRVMIARALMHDPKVLFLDEPSTGLDPQARLFVHDRVTELRDHGVTVVLTTHDMDEAAKLCDRVGIVDHGRLLALDTPDALTRSLPGSTTVSVSVTLNGVAVEKVSALLGELGGIERVEIVTAAPAFPTGMPGGFPPFGGGRPTGAPPVSPPADGFAQPLDGDRGQYRVYATHEPATVLPAVLRRLADLGCAVTDLGIGTPSLEDVFIHLTGRELR